MDTSPRLHRIIACTGWIRIGDGGFFGVAATDYSAIFFFQITHCNGREEADKEIWSAIFSLFEQDV